LLSIEQIVALCGNGKLTDNSDCSVDLREYFQLANSENLRKYLQTCLLSAFERSGLVLQDIVNEFGRRLDYTVALEEVSKCVGAFAAACRQMRLAASTSN